MRILLHVVFVLMAALLTGCGGSAATTPHTTLGAGNGKGGAQSYVVLLTPGSTAADLSSLKARVSSAPTQTYTHALTGFAVALSAAEVSSLRTDPRVAIVEPDITVNAAAPKNRGGTAQLPQTTPWGVNRIGASLNTGSGGAGITVAVLDTGIELSHPDLTGAIVAQYDATGGGNANDTNGHGTAVAGVIAARNNAIGYVGVAPNCSLAAVKVLDNRGTGKLSWTLAGIDWCVANRNAHNIRVGNLGFSTFGSSAVLDTALSNAAGAGIVFVAAAGNAHMDAANFAPAASPSVITVSALTMDNTFAPFSNYGSVVDLIAPGTVWSLWTGGSYKINAGTSIAAPHVAGAVALLLDDEPEGDGIASDDFQQTYDALQAEAEAHPSGKWPGDPDNFGEKLVNAKNL